MLLKKLKIIIASILSIFVLVSIVFAFYNESSEEKVSTKTISSTDLSHYYIAYYFHGNARCQSCYKIESFTTWTIKNKFVQELEKKELLLKVVNIDERMNSHFIRDYSLNTKSVVLSEVDKGKEVRWKNLDRIWELLGDQSQFSSYIEAELRDFLIQNKK